MPQSPKTPMETAVMLLTRQPLSRLALKRRLHDKGFSWKDSEETVSECERYGYINDKLIAEARVALMRDRGDGAKKIKLHLRLKGFEKEVIEEAFKTDDRNSERNEISRPGDGPDKEKDQGPADPRGKRLLGRRLV